MTLMTLILAHEQGGTSRCARGWRVLLLLQTDYRSGGASPLRMRGI